MFLLFFFSFTPAPRRSGKVARNLHSAEQEPRHQVGGRRRKQTGLHQQEQGIRHRLPGVQRQLRFKRHQEAEQVGGTCQEEAARLFRGLCDRLRGGLRGGGGHRPARQERTEDEAGVDPPQTKGEEGPSGLGGGGRVLPAGARQAPEEEERLRTILRHKHELKKKIPTTCDFPTKMKEKYCRLIE